MPCGGFNLKTCQGLIDHMLFKLWGTCLHSRFLSQRKGFPIPSLSRLTKFKLFGKKLPFFFFFADCHLGWAVREQTVASQRVHWNRNRSTPGLPPQAGNKTSFDVIISITSPPNLPAAPDKAPLPGCVYTSVILGRVVQSNSQDGQKPEALSSPLAILPPAASLPGQAQALTGEHAALGFATSFVLWLQASLERLRRQEEKKIWFGITLTQPLLLPAPIQRAIAIYQPILL